MPLSASSSDLREGKIYDISQRRPTLRTKKERNITRTTHNIASDIILLGTARRRVIKRRINGICREAEMEGSLRVLSENNLVRHLYQQ
jgi:hypothetical protein